MIDSERSGTEEPNTDSTTGDNIESFRAKNDSVAPAADLSNVANPMGMIMNIPVTITMELGRVTMSVKDVMSLSPGSVIELRKLVSDPIEVLVNGQLVAYGEAVSSGDNYGIRITEVLANEQFSNVPAL